MRILKLAVAVSLILFSTSDAASSKSSKRNPVPTKKVVPTKKLPIQGRPPIAIPAKPLPLPQSEPSLAPVVEAPAPIITPPVVEAPVSTVFEQILPLLEIRNAKSLVETGTSDPRSTSTFAAWVLQNGAHLTSINCESPLDLSSEAVTFSFGDSVGALEGFNAPIDFLYLDNRDYDENDPSLSQEHHFWELLAAYPFLTPDSIVMIGGCDLPGGGKGKFVIEHLLEKGWHIIADGSQVILAQQ